MLSALTCAFLSTPWTERDAVQYQIGGAMITLGIVLWAITWVWNRAVRAKKTGFRHPDELGG